MDNKRTNGRTFWSDDHRREAANHYAVTGSLQATSDATGIPYTTVLDWSKGRNDKSGAFLAQCEIVREQKTTEFIAKYEAIADKALAGLNDKLDAGEGSVRDLVTVAGISTDKALILSGKPSRISANQGVEELAKQFAKLSQMHQEQTTECIEHKGEEGSHSEAPVGANEAE